MEPEILRDPEAPPVQYMMLYAAGDKPSEMCDMTIIGVSGLPPLL